MLPVFCIEEKHIYTHTYIYKRQGWALHKKYKANKSSRTPVTKEHNKSHERTQDTRDTLINKKTLDKKGAVYHKSASNEDALAKVLYLGTLAQIKAC